VLMGDRRSLINVCLATWAMSRGACMTGHQRQCLNRATRKSLAWPETGVHNRLLTPASKQPNLLLVGALATSSAAGYSRLSRQATNCSHCTVHLFYDQQQAQP
jgi:hypothetical protein